MGTLLLACATATYVFMPARNGKADQHPHQTVVMGLGNSDDAMLKRFFFFFFFEHGETFFLNSSFLRFTFKSLTQVKPKLVS